MFYTYAKQQVVIGVSFTFLGASRQISNQIEEKIILVTRSLVTWSSREHIYHVIYTHTSFMGLSHRICHYKRYFSAAMRWRILE